MEGRLQRLGHGARSLLSLAFVVLTTLSLVTASTAYWNRNVALDTDAWMDVVDPVISSDRFTAELSERLTEAVIEIIGVEDRLEESLGNLDVPEAGPIVGEIVGLLGVPSLGDLAGMLVTSVEGRLESEIQDVLQSDEFQSTVQGLIRRAHSAFVALATDNVDAAPALYVEDGLVRLNALRAVVEALEFVIGQGILGENIEISLPDLSDNPVASESIQRLSDSLGIEVRDDVGQITIMTTDQLDRLQSAADVLDRLVWLLLGTTIILSAIALVVSPHRRRTTVQLGIGAAIGLLASYFVVVFLIARMQEWFADDGARSVFVLLGEEVSSSIRGVWIAIGLAALLIGVTAYVMGRPAWLDKNQAADS